MSQINPDQIQRIKDALRIEEVIGDYVSLTKRGVNHIGVCPFHDEKTPSLVVSPTKGMFKCFGCGAGGDVIKFVQDHEAVSFPDALKILARKANIELDETPMTEEEQRAAREREALLNTNQYAQSQFALQLTQQKVAREWIAGRGITPESIAEFQIGFAPAGNFLTAQAEAGKLNIRAAERLSLIKTNERGQRYDAFRHRATYPFLSLSGQIIGFTARKIDWQKGDQSAKFLNSDESPLFKKDRAVFGLFQAKRHIVQQNKCYWVEGQHDVISLHQCEVKNVVCGSGTALTSLHVREVMRFTHNITFIFDGDPAGIKATLRAIETALSEGASVRVISLPEGMDPDDFARKHPENLPMTLSKMETVFLDFLLKQYESDLQDEFKRSEIIDELARIFSLIENKEVRDRFVYKLKNAIDADEEYVFNKIKQLYKPRKKTWKDGIYGTDEAKDLLKQNPDRKSYLTFSEEYFLENIDEKPVIYAHGDISKSDIQSLRTSFSELHVNNTDAEWKFGNTESPRLLVLKELFKVGMKINIEGVQREDETTWSGFLDYYVSGYRSFMLTNIVTENDRANYIDRCAEMIAFADTTLRTVVMKGYAKDLGLTQADLKAIVQPYLEKKKDRAVLEKQNIDIVDDLLSFDIDRVLSYVEEDEVMKANYINYGFYPLINKKQLPVSYMFKNEKGGGHSRVSDFFMEPLLHIYNRDSEGNKRVIKLNHIHGQQKYVEWKSSTLATLGKVKEKLLDEGAFNFEGSMMQFNKIWIPMSYQFKECTEMRVFGQQPEEFWAFTNAIAYDEENKDGTHETKIDYADHLGVMSYKNKHYYSPAFSEIYNAEREEDDRYKMERFFTYREIPENMRIDFAEWARQMDVVYHINDNGKWAILIDVMSCFRDYIFSQRRFFTTLFFIGPTGSGKSQIAESMRSLFMPPEAPVFNLNFGSDASFFIVLENYKNVVSIMEEYNDSTISQTKFQGLKAAVFDGEGKTKVKDIATKALDRSKINSIPVILGQEAPQQDDGSLANRCILCDVPNKGKGEWTVEETANFERLKRHEQAGLCNVLLEIISHRQIFKRHFNYTFAEEAKNVKNAVITGVSNNEGLTRIINSVALVTATCKILEEHTDLKLPFSYAEFFKIATHKVMQQVEMISSSNKLTNYFQTIAYLINQGAIQIGKELKVSVPPNGQVTVKVSGNKTETVDMPSMETKVLYINFGAIYPLYRKEVKDPLTQQSLQNYFRSNKAFIGLTRSTQFKWYEQKIGVQPETADNELTGPNKPGYMIEPRVNNTSAYMFNYDELRQLMDVDFERTEQAADDEPENVPF